MHCGIVPAPSWTRSRRPIQSLSLAERHRPGSRTRVENRHRRVLPRYSEKTDFPARKRHGAPICADEIASDLDREEHPPASSGVFISGPLPPRRGWNASLGVGHDDQPIPQPKELRRQLRQAQRWKPWAAWLAASHYDFNLLTIISSWVELLMDEPGLTSIPSAAWLNQRCRGTGDRTDQAIAGIHPPSNRRTPAPESPMIVSATSSS